MADEADRAQQDTEVYNASMKTENDKEGTSGGSALTDGLEPVAWRRLDTLKSVVTESEHIARGWKLDGLFFEALYSQDQLQAAVVAEREACAKVCDGMSSAQNNPYDCANAIRRRSNASGQGEAVGRSPAP